MSVDTESPDLLSFCPSLVDILSHVELLNIDSFRLVSRRMNDVINKNEKRLYKKLIDTLLSQSEDGLLREQEDPCFPPFQEERPRYYESVQHCIQSLVHCCQCRNSECRRMSCHKMKRVVQHTKMCKKRVNASCPVCKQLIALCCYHIRHCSRDPCSVPFCTVIRRKLAGQKRSLKRSAEMMMNGRMDGLHAGFSGVASEASLSLKANRMFAELSAASVLPESTKTRRFGGVPGFVNVKGRMSSPSPLTKPTSLALTMSTFYYLMRAGFKGVCPMSVPSESPDLLSFCPNLVDILSRVNRLDIDCFRLVSRRMNDVVNKNKRRLLQPGSLTCNKCANNANFHCNTCEDFDLCETCYCFVIHEHPMEQIKTLLTKTDGHSAGRNRYDSIHRCIQSLVHACRCRDSDCLKMACPQMKRIVQHAKLCKKRLTDSCPVCKQLLILCSYHSMNCNQDPCSVAFCLSFKKKRLRDRRAEMLIRRR